MSIRLTNILPDEARVLCEALDMYTGSSRDMTLASDMADVLRDQMADALKETT